MNVLILAAGYGTRLAKGIEEDKSGEFEKLKGLPKGLLPIGDKPLISHWVVELNRHDFVETICVISNAHFYEKFDSWHSNLDIKSKVILLNDGSMTNETRLGAVGSIQFAIDNIDGFRSKPLLVIAGDTLFYKNFSIQQFYKTAISEPSIEAQVTAYRVNDNETSKYGIIETDQNGIINGFLEKPDSSQTKSRLACPCFYFLKTSTFEIIDEFLISKEESPLKEKDATGYFLAYLRNKTRIGTFNISGRYDVGNLEQYIECSRAFSTQ